jgi:hypothetical protein
MNLSLKTCPSITTRCLTLLPTFTVPRPLTVNGSRGTNPVFTFQTSNRSLRTTFRNSTLPPLTTIVKFYSTSQNHISKSPPRLPSPLGRRSPV